MMKVTLFISSFLIVCILGSESDRECPPSQPLTMCSAMPCDVAECLGWEGITCENNFCGGCNAIFRDSSGNILTDKDCRRCPPNSAFPLCAEEPCSVSNCPAVPGATCRNFLCKGCFAIFIDKNGRELSKEECLIQ